MIRRGRPANIERDRLIFERHEYGKETCRSLATELGITESRVRHICWEQRRKNAAR